MAIVSGTLWDVGNGHLVGKQPELIFELNKPGVKSGALYVTEPLSVTPAADGTWSADLPTTTNMQDDAFYSVAIRWLDRAGNYVRMDFPDWVLQIPSAGGLFSDLFGRPPSNQRIVYVSLTPPDKPRPFTLWLKQDSANPTNPANTGNLYEWRNV